MIDLQEKCIAHWKFNQINNNVIEDAMGNHHGVFHPASGPTVVFKGLIGNAISLDGTQHIEIPSHIDFNFTNKKLSIAGWFKSTNDANDASLLSRGDAQHPGDTDVPWMFNISGGPPSDTFALTINHVINDDPYVTQGTYIDRPAPPGTFADGLWHLVIVTYDASLSSNNFILCMDNLQLGTAQTDPDRAYDFTVTEDNILLATLGSGFLYSGKYDSFMIFNEALTAEEKTWLYNKGAGRSNLVQQGRIR